MDRFCIPERGEGVLAVVQVLREFLPPDETHDIRLVKWVDDLIATAEKFVKKVVEQDGPIPVSFLDTC